MGDYRILVVDDEIAERLTLGEVLRLDGFQVQLAASGEDAVALNQAGPPFDAVVLDLKLPRMDGLQVLDALHRSSPDTVVILITGYGTLETAIQAMRRGAYDYLLKPCPVEEIIMTIRRGMSELERERHRRQLMGVLQETVDALRSVDTTQVLPPEVLNDDRFLHVGELMMDRSKHLVTLEGHAVDVTPTEFKLLECLLQHVDEVCTPQQLVRCAQGYDADAWGARSIVRVHIRRLRRKLERNPEQPRYIVNVRGVGYILTSIPGSYANDPDEDS